MSAFTFGPSCNVKKRRLIDIHRLLSCMKLRLAAPLCSLWDCAMKMETVLRGGSIRWSDRHHTSFKANLFGIILPYDIVLMTFSLHALICLISVVIKYYMIWFMSCLIALGLLLKYIMCSKVLLN